MLGPSGFFQTIDGGGSPISSSDLEILHDSEVGFNTLYKVSKNGRFFVYKALKKEYAGNPLYEELLKKDFNIGFSLTHSNICQYYGMVNLPLIGNCIVMEWVDGCSLETMIEQGRIDKDVARKIICELCDALDYMHRKQVVHRDLKPENILVTYNGNNVKIIDFGLSDTDSYNVFKAPAGTKVYASPELLAGDQIDGRSDIWSLGMVMNEITPYYRYVASRCMRRDVGNRYSTASDVKNAVLAEGRRRVFRCIGLILLAVSVSFGLMYVYQFLVRSLPDPVVTETQTEPVEEMKDSLVVPVEVRKEDVMKETDVPVAPLKSAAKEEAADTLDAAALEDLFKEASEQIF